MEKMKTKLIQGLLVLLTVGLVLFAASTYYGNLVVEMERTGHSALETIGGRANMGLSFIETMSAYGTAYLRDNLKVDTSDLHDYLKYNPETDSYSLDAFESTALQLKAGNLTGKGEIPTDAEVVEELGLVFLYNSFFSQIYARMPEISRIYYTSRNGFQNVYPWVHSRERAYSDELLQAPFFLRAGPESNPSHWPVWVTAPAGTEGEDKILSLSAPVYDGVRLRGVVTIDYAGKTLLEPLAKEDADYETFLVDKQLCVVSALNNEKIDQSLVEVLGLTAEEEGQLRGAGEAQAFSVGRYFVYKSTIPETTIMLVVAIPQSRVVLKAFFLTFPIILVAALLLGSLYILAGLRRVERKLKLTSITDPLTGLKNRRYLDRVIDEELVKAGKNRQKLSLISLDIDRFKNVNDIWGHQVGDEVLKLVGESIMTKLCREDTLVRMGGEEFMVLLPRTGIQEAFEVAEKIRLAVKAAEHPRSGNITVSLGIAEYRPGESCSDLYRRVDKAMYAAKLAGRDRTHIYSEATDTDNEGGLVMTATWNKNWDCGEETIDNQHREIIDYANELMHMSRYSEDAQRLIELILDKTQEHFAYEESVLRERDYSEVEKHSREHSRLIQETQLLWEKVKQGNTKPQVLFAYLYAETVTRHMLEDDIKFFYLFKEN